MVRDKLDYRPEYPTTDDSTFFKNKLEYYLIETYEELEEIFEPLKDMVISFDTETSGLTFYKDYIVGFSFAVSPYKGYYVPLRHKPTKSNLPVKKTLDLLYDKLLMRNLILGYNLPFDMIMLQAEGYNVMPIKMFDVLVLVYNADTNYTNNGLKTASKLILNRESPEFTDIVGTEATFDMLKPEEGTYYAVCDAVNTFALYCFLYEKLVKECKKILEIDNKLMKVLIYYLQNPVYIDKNKMNNLGIEVLNKIMEIDGKIFKYFGRLFNIQSNREVSRALLEKGIDTGVRTKTGDMGISEKLLVALNHDITNLILKRRSLFKQYSSYIKKFAEVDYGYVNYNPCRVPTGRLASGNKINKNLKNCNLFFLPLNFQNLTKSDAAMYRTYKSHEEGNILGYCFEEVTKDYMKMFPDETYVEGFDQKLNIRNAITVPNTKDWYLVSIDYESQELKVAANESKEPNMLNPFKNKGDLHKETAVRIWGEENYDSGKRRLAKAVNFGILYGGTGKTIARTTGNPLIECEEAVKKWWSVMTNVGYWKSRSVSEAYTFGCTYSYFGRPRRLTNYLNNIENRWRSFGERTVISHKIQGSCSDIMRMDLIALYEQIFSNPKNYNEVRFVGTVHDEILFCVKKDRFEYWIDIFLNIMTYIDPTGEWELPLTNSVEVGYTYGSLFGFKKEEDGKWHPC